ncbi:MAG: secretin and TonB N-terminal domain-containing protein [Myxococcota bacterium]
MATGLVLAGLLCTVPESPSEARAAQRSRASARRIDIELQDSEVHDVLQLLADIGRVNIVVASGVDGRVTARFKATPWDEVLAHVLRALQLTSRRDGNVIYVQPAQ